MSLENYFVYVLLSLKDGKFYVGYSRHLNQRLKQHSRGEVISTMNRRPLKIVHYEWFLNEKDAKARERFLKSGFGREQLRASLKRTLFTI